MGVLRNVENFPPHRIPSSCRHSDILKNIMIHCRALTFSTIFSHVSAHKLDHLAWAWEELSRPEQLNEQCESGAKLAIYDTDPNAGIAAQPLPLEPICVYVDKGKEKMTSDTGEWVRFHDHRKLVREIFAKRQILLSSTFAQVDWIHVNKSLHEVPRLFQLWACQQVQGIAVTIWRLHKCDQRIILLCVRLVWTQGRHALT